MDRRETLRFLTLAYLASLVPFSKNLAIQDKKPDNKNNLYAIDPVTGVTLGISVAKLFLGMFQSNRGPSIVDFIKNTNKQLDIISKKIDVLFDNIDELKGMVRELPTEVVSKLKQIELKGRIDDYKAVLLEVSLNTYKGNILKYVAVEENKMKVTRIVDSIKDIKSQLRQINDPLLVPFIAIAVHVEYYLRNNFLQQKWENFIGDINNDAIWLNDYVFNRENSIKNNLNELRESRKSLLENNNISFNVKSDSRRLASQWIYSVVLKPVTDSSIKEEKEIEDLRDIGLIFQNEKPLKFEILHEKRYDAAYYITLPPEYPEEFADNIRNRLIAAKNNELKLNYYSIIAFTTASYAGLKAIEFCNIYLRAANYKK